MALITSSTQNVDLIKLKSEIEAYFYGADNTKFLVRGSQTNSSGQLELDIIIAQTGSPNLTTNQIVVLSDLIVNHQNNQRKRIIVSDAPDANDAAANKQFVQQQVNEAVSNLIGSAPTILDTLGEIAEIMAKDPVTGVYPNSIAPSIISRLDTLENNPAITKLDDLSDVVVDSLLLEDNQVLKYNALTNAWINASAGTTFNSDITVNGITVGKGNNSLTGNTALGAYALISVQGNPNTPFGPGDDNTAIGAYALSANTTGQMNVAVGSGGTLGNNTTGSQNIAIGAATLIGNSTGDSNIAIGKNALMWNNTSSNNVAIGEYALGSTTGQKNIAIGNEAGYAITTGSYNVVIGGNSGSSIATSDGNILISDGQGNIRIKSDGSGRIGINNLSPQAALHVNSEGYVGLIVKGSVSQTANLLEIQNSSGNITSSISSNGSGTFNGLRCTAKSLFDTSSFGSPHGVTGTNTYNSKIYQHAFWGASNGPTMLVQCSGINEALVCAQGSSTLFSVTDRGTTISETSFESYALSLVANNAHATPTNIAKFQQLGVDKVVISKEGNLTATGTGTFNAPAAASKGLVVKGAASQAASLFEVQDSSAATLMTIDATGSVAISDKKVGATATTLALTTTNIYSRMFRLTAAAGHAANMIELFNNAGTLLSSFGNDGQLYDNGMAVLALRTHQSAVADGTSSTFYGSDVYNQNVWVAGVAKTAVTHYNMSGQYIQWTAGNAPAAGALVEISGTLTSWRNSAGDGTGFGYFPYLSVNEKRPGTSATAPALHVGSRGAGLKGIVIKAAASQTANLFEAQSNSGTALFSIDKDGSVAAGTVPVARVSGLATVATTGSYNDLSDTPTLSATLDDLTDVNLTTPTSDQILKYDGLNWVNAQAPVTGATSLDELSDVVIASASKGQFIVHNGTQFVNSNTITVSSTPVVIKAAVSQTANVFEVQNGIGTALFSINNQHTTYISSGHYLNEQPVLVLRSVSNGDNSSHPHILDIKNGWGNTVAYIKPTGSAQFSTTLASVVPLTIKAASGQTANLFEAQNLFGTALFAINSSGAISAGSVPAALIVDTLPITNGGTGQTTAQAAINALTQVSTATSGHVLTKHTDGHASWKPITSTTFALPTGSAGSPALFFTDDTNTGFYRQSEDKLTFVANGQNALVVDGNSGVGRLMIGNGTPISRIQIADDTITTAAGITFGTNSASYSQIYRSATKELTCDSTIKAVAFTPTSDYRIKENFTEINNALSVISKLKPGTYTLREDYISSKPMRAGLVAHEVQDVLPFLVSGQKNEKDELDNPIYQSVNYMDLIAYLIAATKELGQKNCDLLEKIESLESELKSFKNLLLNKA